MSQVTSYDIPGSPLNMTNLATDLEALFAAAASCNRGGTAPSNPFEGMLWWDSSSNPEILKRYTVTAGWVSIASVDITTGAVLYSAYDADLATLSLPANTTISAFMKTVLDDADAATARTTLGVDPFPPGIMMPYGGATAPTGGWLLCYGQTVSQTTYANLFAAIGHSFGADPGGGNFILPDMRGRVPLGKDNMGGSSANRVTDAAADTVGATSGAEKKDISHDHDAGTLAAKAHTHGLPFGTDNGAQTNFAWKYGQITGTQWTGASHDSDHVSGNSADGVTINQVKTDASITEVVSGKSAIGGSSTQDVMNPYVTVNYIIKY